MWDEILGDFANVIGEVIADAAISIVDLFTGDEEEMQNTVGAIRVESGEHITFSCHVCGHKPRPRIDHCGGLHAHRVLAVTPKGGAAVISLRPCGDCTVKTYTAKPDTQTMYVDV